MSSQPCPSPTGNERIEGVRAESQGDEHGAQDERLIENAATGRVDELRQEGQEEERDLRVERLDHHSL